MRERLESIRALREEAERLRTLVRIQADRRHELGRWLRSDYLRR